MSADSVYVNKTVLPERYSSAELSFVRCFRSDPTHGCLQVQLTALRLRETRTPPLFMSRDKILELESTLHAYKARGCARHSLPFLEAAHLNANVCTCLVLKGP